MPTAAKKTHDGRGCLSRDDRAYPCIRSSCAGRTCWLGIASSSHRDQNPPLLSLGHRRPELGLTRCVPPMARVNNPHVNTTHRHCVRWMGSPRDAAAVVPVLSISEDRFTADAGRSWLKGDPRGRRSCPRNFLSSVGRYTMTDVWRSWSAKNTSLRRRLRLRSMSAR